MNSETQTDLPTDVVKSNPSDFVKEKVLKGVPKITKQTKKALPGKSKVSPDLTSKSIIKTFDLICSKHTPSIANKIQPETSRPVISSGTVKSMLHNITSTDNKICTDASKSLLKPLKEPVFIKAAIIPKSPIKERQTLTSTTSSSNVSLREDNNIKRAFYDKSLTLNQAVEQFKMLSSKDNEIALIKPGSDEVIFEYLENESTHITSKPNSLELKPEEKLKILGFARENTEGQLIYTDFTNVNENTPNTSIESPSRNCKTSTLIVNMPNSKKKQITILLPPDIYKNEPPKTVVSDCQKEKNAINKKTQTSIYGLLSGTGQMVDTESEHLPVSPDQDLNQDTTTVQKTFPYSVRQSQQSVTSALDVNNETISYLVEQPQQKVTPVLQQKVTPVKVLSKTLPLEVEQPHLNVRGLDLQKTLSHSLEQSHQRVTPALDLGKSLQFTSEQPQSKVTTALKLQKSHSLELLQTTDTSVSNPQKTIVPNTSVPNSISISMEKQHVHKSIGNNETLFSTTIGKPKVQTVLPIKNMALSTATSEKNILLNLVPYLNQDVDLSKSVTFKENCSQYHFIKPNMSEKEILINNLNNNFASNQLIPHTLDKLPSSEYVIEKNNANNFNSISDNNNFQNIRRGNTEVMWSTVNFNSTDNLKQSVLLCALKDMTQCRKEDDEGNIPLQKAVLDNDKNTLKRQCIILKTVGLQYLNHQNKSLDTALLLAVKRNQEVSVATLLNYGANQTIVDKDGNSALHVAVYYGLLVCARLLLAAEGARDIINAFNDEGFAPIHLAAMGGYNEIVRALVSEGADINKKDAKSGRTAYHHGIILNNPDVLKVLGGLGCNTSELDFAGHLPLFEESVIVNSSTIKHSSLLMKNDRKESENVLPGQIPQFEPAGFNQTQTLSKSKYNTSEVVNNRGNRNEADSDKPQFEFIKQPNTKPSKHKDITSLVDINKNVNENTTVRKNKRRRRNEVLTISSDDSDADCVVINTSFVPARKRRRRRLNKVFCISDDDSNNDSAIINISSPDKHSYISDVPIVTSFNNDAPIVTSLNSDIPVVTSLNSDIPIVTSLSSDIPILTSLNSDVPIVTSLNNDVPVVTSLNSDVPIVTSLNSDVSIVHTYNSYMPVVKSHVCDMPLVDCCVSIVPLIWPPNSNMTTINSQKNAVPVINSLNCDITKVYSYNSNVPIAHSHQTNVTSIPKLHTDDENFKGFTSDDDLSDNQVTKMEDIIKKFIHDSQVF